MTNLLSVSSRMLLSLAMVLESFCGCFDTSSLVKLPIEESMVKLLSSASSLRSSYYFTFCSKFIY